MLHSHEDQSSFPFAEPRKIILFTDIPEKPPQSLGDSQVVYNAYPLKIGRPVALRAIEKAIREHGFDRVLERTLAFAKARGANRFEPPRVPNPSTWYNQERFNDDPETWGTFDQQTPTPAKLREIADQAPEGWELFARTSPIHCEYAGNWKSAPQFMKQDFEKWRAAR